MPTSLVTGAAGFIGSHVVDELVTMGHDVVALDDLSGGDRANVNAVSQFVHGSILDEELIKKLFRQRRFDFVFHFAAYAAEGLSHFIKRFNYENNLIGSVNVINASVNAGTVRCFVFTSSIAVYGRSQVPMTEEMVPRPEDPYGIAKHAVEQDLHESYAVFGLPSVVFRPHNVYGPRQNVGDGYRNVVGILMNKAIRREPLTIFGDGEQTRAFSYISDVAPLIARACGSPNAYNEVFNVGADTPSTVNRLAEIVSDAMGVPLRVTHLEARHEVKHAYSSHDKVARFFPDLVPRVSLEAGVAKMAEWVRRHGSRTSQFFSNVEVRKNIPPSWAAWLDAPSPDNR